MNKIKSISDNYKTCDRINLSQINPEQFKTAFRDSMIFDSVLKDTDLDILAKRFFKLSILLSDSKTLANNQRSDILLMLGGLYSLGKKLLDCGGLDKIEPEILLNEFASNGILDHIIDIETITRLAILNCVMCEVISNDQLALDSKDRDSINMKFYSLLILVENLIISETNE